MAMNDDERWSEEDHLEAARRRLLRAALAAAPFDGWSAGTLAAAADETGIEPGLARLAFPRGVIDALLYLHADLDRKAAVEIGAGAGDGRIRDRVTAAVRTRIELGEPHREAIRRGAATLALPGYASEGVRSLLRTADMIWTALGDKSTDYNWYTKRAILAGVYGATLAFWLGDESEERRATWAYLDRRIAGVMRFERIKSRVRGNPLARCLLAPARTLARCAPRPQLKPPTGFPG